MNTNNHRREQPERPIRLIRGPDGRLKAKERSNIGDIWAEQKRIRLQDAIEADRRKAEKLKNKGQKSKEVVVNIRLPKIKVPKFRPGQPKINKKWLFVAILAVLMASTGIVAYKLFVADDEPKVVRGVLDASGRADQTPDFATVLPDGKDIDELGGWVRVSPPDKDPVFAYVDVVSGFHLNISQQQLPDNFKRDKDAELAKLAQQFSANEKITAGETVAYIGTSAKGPQSVITSIDDLLILIKSSGPLTTDQWTEYIASLN